MTMETVTIGVASLDTVTRRAREAFKGKNQGSFITFKTPE